MDIIPQLLVTGIALGFIYCLIGIEFTIVYQSTHLLNMAHGMIITFGAYLFGGTMINGLGLPYWLGIILTVLACGVMGYAISALIFNPLRAKGMIFSLVACGIFGNILASLYLAIWGSYAFTVPGFLSGVITVGSARIAKSYTYIIITAIFLIVVYELFSRKTRLGKSLRCVAQNPNAAALMGIKVSQNINISVAISSMICGVVGILVIPLFGIKTTMATTVALKGWIACVVGGFGYLPGTIVGGLILGISETFVAMAIPSVFKDVVSFVILIAMLLIRPGGIMRDKVR